MLNISDEVKNLFLQDSTKKKLTIDIFNPDHMDLSEFNYYKGNSGYAYGATFVLQPDGYNAIYVMYVTGYTADLTNYVDYRAVKYKDYLRVSLYFQAANIRQSITQLEFRVNFKYDDDFTDYLNVVIDPNDYADFSKLNFGKIPTYSEDHGYLKSVFYIEMHNIDSSAFDADMGFSRFQIEMGNDDNEFPTSYVNTFSKDYDIEDFVTLPPIENDKLEFESFSMTESLCSQDNIKFGLCESAHCEFTTVGYNYDLKDRTIRPKISVQGVPSYEDILNVNWWNDKAKITVPGSVFHDVKTVTGVNYWTSHFLFYTDIYQYDYYFSQAPRVMLGYKLKINSLTTITGSAPVYFKIGVRCVYADGTEQNRMGSVKHSYTEASDFAFFSLEVLYNSQDHGKIIEVQRPLLAWHDANKNLLTNNDSYTIDAEFTEFMIYMYDDPTYTHYPEYDTDTCYVYYGTLDNHFSECYSDPIPLGEYHVTDVKLEHNHKLVKQNVTAYDNIVKLEQNAYNWYTTYMFGMSTSDKQGRYDIQYARQIFSAYFNLMQQFGLEDRSNYTETLLGTYEYWDDILPSHMANKWLIWDSSAEVGRMRYSEFTINDVDTSKLYMVDAVNVAGDTDKETEAIVPSDYETNFDPLRRGIATNGGVLVEFYNSNNALLDGIVVNRRDYFMVYPETSYIKVYIPTYDAYGDGTRFMRFIDSVSLYEVSSAPNLVNAYYRLFYYNYDSQANESAVIFDADSSMTGRDVIHSLLEVCGCFFRLDRINGKPEFIYCTKGGLYPRNDLYPADDLYPRSGTDQLLPNGRYMSVIQDDYSVKDYGKIQIVRSTDSNETKSICEWEYKGSDSTNTYLIDDNVFYCNKDLKYEYDSMPYISELLVNMWLQISNMGYVPNVTEALGMPWIECGDRVGVITYTGGFETFVFRRTMKGIQLLIDTYESEGDESNEAIKDFGYELYN